MALTKDDYANYSVGDAADFNERRDSAWPDDHVWEIEGERITEKEMREMIAKSNGEKA